MSHEKRWLCLIWLLACAASLHAQTALTSLRGTVTDPSGGTVPDATVVIENQASGLHITRTTDTNGAYEFAQIPPGQYKITVKMAGFGAQSKQAELLVNQPATINFAMSVQSANEVVEVSAAAQTLNMTDATIGNSVSNSTIEALPMEGRNVPDLLSLQPGVLYLGRQVNPDLDSRSGAVAGARSDQSNVTLDGVDNNDQRQGYAFNGVLRSTLDSVEEFRVTTTNSNAEDGRSSGAQVVLVTKSGTNNLHGSAYEYNRNAAAVANDTFLKAAELSNGLPNKPGALIRNTFGGSLGGPIKKDKLFFFLNYESQRTAENKPVTQTVPTASLRTGNVKYVDANGNVQTLCGPNFSTPGSCPNASPKNDLAAMDLNCTSAKTCPWGPGADPNVLADLNKYPLPNGFSSGDGLNTASFVFSAPNPITLNTYVAKADYVLSDRSRFFVRGILQGDRDSGPPQFPGEPPSFSLTNTSKGIAAGHTWTLRNNLINNLRYGYVREQLDNTGAGTSSYSDFVGIAPLSSENRTALLAVAVHNLVDDVTWIKGKHTFQFGGNWRLIHNNTLSNNVSFASATTGAANISQAAIANTGQSFDPAAFGYSAVSSGFSSSYDNAITAIAGLLSTINVNNNYKVSADGARAALVPAAALISRNFKANEGEWYAQDAFRMKPNLTITVGVRYSLLQTPYEVNGQQVAPTIDLHQWFENRAIAAKQGLGNQPPISFAPSGQGRGGQPYWPMNKNNFAPRVSVAYSPDSTDGLWKSLFGGPGKTAIRAGFGLYYDHFGEGIVDGFSQFGSFGLTSTQAAPSNIFTPDDAPRYTGRTVVPVSVLSAPASTVAYPATPSSDPLNGGFTFNSDGINGRIKTPYSMATDLSVQRQLPGGFTFEMAYVGRFGRHLLQQLDLAEPTDLVDPKSGMDYFTAARLMSQFALAHGEDPTAVIGAIPYFEDLFPTAAAGGFSATQNIYTGSGGSNGCSGFSWSNRPGREVGAPFRLGLIKTALANGGVSPVCAGLPPVPFWNPQFSSLFAWSSIGISAYHAGQFILRRPMSHGLQIDFSYTYAKSLDMGSDAERTNSQGTTSTVTNAGSTVASYIQNSWNPRLNYAPSDFDTRHVITANWVYQLPFGRGRVLASKASGWVEALAGGWQVSGLARWTSGLPFSVIDNTGFTNNFLFNSNMVQSGPVKTGVFLNANGVSDVFADPAAVAGGIFSTQTPLRFPFPGEAGSRNNFRGPGYFGIDAGLAKSWRIREALALKFAWEVFNVTNSVRYDARTNAAGSGPLDNGSSDGSSLGAFSTTLTAPRVQQFSLRLTF
jgi:hypothetical protein